MSAQPRESPSLLCGQEQALFFVYGTLRRGFEHHPILQRLGARFAGRGTVPARLYDLGDFPGARAGGGRVTGELYALNHPAAFKLLDAIEGFHPARPLAGLFRRQQVTVVLANGGRTGAWIYWLNRSPAGARRIVSGDYRRK